MTCGFEGSSQRYRMLGLFYFLCMGLLPVCSLGQSGSGWTWVDTYEHCVGGDECSLVGPLYLKIEDRPVEFIRFEAHDDVGKKRSGELRIRIGDQILRDNLLIARRPESYEIPGRRAQGRELIFEPLAHDEVIIRKIEIAYARERSHGATSRRRDAPSDSSGWQSRDSDRDERAEDRRRRNRGWDSEHRQRETEIRAGTGDQNWQDGSTQVAALREVGCVGGGRCRHLKIAVRFIRKARIGRIRFFAHDFLGKDSGGRLRVLLDDRELADQLDIPKSGKLYELDGRGQLAETITFVPQSNDEVLIKDLEVFELSEREGRRPSPKPQASRWRGAGTCLGEEACGKRWSLEIPVLGGVDGIRFFAHSDLGRGYGRLRLVTDRGDVLTELEVSRSGNFHDSTLKEGVHYLILEILEGDVILEEIELRSGNNWERYRPEQEQEIQRRE